MTRLLSTLLGLALAATPVGAAPRTKAKPAPPPAPYAGVYQPQGVDEIGLWREADEWERSLANSRLIITDEALNAYVKALLCATIGADRCNSVRVYLLRAPIANAGMTANGTMLVFSGLLLRARNEAELAAVLGHEFGHFEKRHTLRQFKAERRGSDILSWAAVLTSLSGSRQAYQNFDNLRTTIQGGLARYSRDQEREADLLGLGYLNNGKLRPGAASRFWRNAILEAEASAAARGLRKPDFDRLSSFLASHPANGERVDYLYELAATDGESREDGAERYAAALGPWLPAFLDDQIGLNNFGATDFIINRLAESGWTATLWRARGDLFRARGHQRDLMNAADFYGKAVALDATLAEAHRGLGLSLIKTGRASEGRASLERYMQLKPDASDAAMIGMTLASIGDKQ